MGKTLLTRSIDVSVATPEGPKKEVSSEAFPPVDGLSGDKADKSASNTCTTDLITKSVHQLGQLHPW